MSITREAAEALIREQLVDTIFQDVPKQSIVMQLGRRLPNMTSKQTKIPVLDMLPISYWVNGDTGFKQTSKQAWDNVYLTAAELAVIVPIPEAVLDDASFDIMGNVTPRVNEACAQRVDSAILFGEGRPLEWQNDILTVARQAGNNVGGNITYDALMGEDGIISKVEQAGYTVDGVIASMRTKGALRGLKDDVNRPLFVSDMQGATRYGLDGAPMYFPENGCFNDSLAQMIVGNFKQLVYSIRQDITVKILDQGVIQDPETKEIVYNLAQQDMLALRVVMRLGWALPNPATRLNPDRSNVPFAYLEAKTPFTDYTATFTVQDSVTTSTKLEGAKINVNGAILKTNASGQAVFNLRPGTYPYTVKMTGYRPASGEITVESSAAAQTVSMVAIKKE